MDPDRIDELARRLSRATARRQVVLGLAASAVGLGARGSGGAAAKARNRKRKDREPRRNAFGCVSVGKRCRKADQCCSGICQGKKGKKRCTAHDTRGCPANSGFLASDECRAEDISCTTATGAPGTCATTTGGAGYCAGGGDCRPCTKDADCQALCGPRAACIQCPAGGCDNTGTACYGPDGTVCPL